MEFYYTWEFKRAYRESTATESDSFDFTAPKETSEGLLLPAVQMVVADEPETKDGAAGDDGHGGWIPILDISQGVNGAVEDELTGSSGFDDWMMAG